MMMMMKRNGTSGVDVTWIFIEGMDEDVLVIVLKRTEHGERSGA